MTDLIRSIEIKSLAEIELMRIAGRLAAETLTAVGSLLKPGITTEEINTFVHRDTLRKGCTPATLGYKGYPKSVCTSVNDVICHGIPGPQVLRAGDIVNVDVTHIYKGFHGDTSATFYIGKPAPEVQRLVETCRCCLELGILEVKNGARLGNIGAAIQEYAEAQGFSVVTAFAGHGIGRVFHCSPNILHAGKRDTGLRMKTGMTFTIEPMINAGVPDHILLEDGWTAKTADGKMSAQFEHTLLVTETGAEVLTARSSPLLNSEERT